MNPEFPSSERVNNLFNLQGVPQVSQILKEVKQIFLNFLIFFGRKRKSF